MHRFVFAVLSLSVLLPTQWAHADDGAGQLQLSGRDWLLVEPYRYDEAQRFERGWNRGVDAIASGGVVRTPVPGSVRFAGEVAGRTVVTVRTRFAGRGVVVTMTGLSSTSVRTGDLVETGEVVGRGLLVHVGVYDESRRSSYLPVIVDTVRSVGSAPPPAVAHSPIADAVSERLERAIAGAGAAAEPDAGSSTLDGVPIVAVGAGIEVASRVPLLARRGPLAVSVRAAAVPDPIRPRTGAPLQASIRVARAGSIRSDSSRGGGGGRSAARGRQLLEYLIAAPSLRMWRPQRASGGLPGSRPVPDGWDVSRRSVVAAREATSSGTNVPESSLRSWSGVGSSRAAAHDEEPGNAGALDPGDGTSSFDDVVRVVAIVVPVMLLASAVALATVIRRRERAPKEATVVHRAHVYLPVVVGRARPPVPARAGTEVVPMAWTPVESGTSDDTAHPTGERSPEHA